MADATIFTSSKTLTAPLPGAPVYLPPRVVTDISINDYINGFIADDLVLAVGDVLTAWPSHGPTSAIVATPPTADARPKMGSEGGFFDVDFDGIDDYLVAPDPGNNPLTLTVVARMKTLPVSGEKSSAFVGFAGGAGGSLHVLASNKRLQQYGTSGSAGPVHDTAWHVITATFPADGVGAVLVRDGGTPVVANIGAVPSPTTMIIGLLTGAGTNTNRPPIRGRRYYTHGRLLSTSEIAQIHTELKAIYSIA